LYQSGDILLVPFPFTNQSGNKVRPVLVIADSHAINQPNDILTVMISTQDKSSGIKIKMDNEFLSIPLKKDNNFIYCNKICVLEESIVRKKISRISDFSLFNQVINSIRGYLLIK
jgi:mRNA interferase MazF